MSNSASGRGDQVGGAAVVTSSNSKPRYKECMKNHAVVFGVHSLDGCGDFMPAGAEGTPEAFKCAACNCHRNFHRKETTSESATQLPTHPQPPPLGTGGAIFFCHQHSVPQFTPYYRTPAGYLHVAEARPGGPPPPQRPLALSSTSHSREDQEGMSNPSGGGGAGGSSRKRFRTKFTAEQKERMLEFASRLRWTIQKNDEAVVQEFCNEIGVNRSAFKIWMQNNKNKSGKKP